MNSMPKKTASSTAPPGAPTSDETMVPARSANDIVIAGATVHIVTVNADQPDAHADQAEVAESGLNTLDPVSQLLWSQALRSMH